MARRHLTWHALSAIVLASVAVFCSPTGCAEGGYFGDWGVADDRLHDRLPDATSNPLPSPADAFVAQTSQPAAEPANLLDSAPESLGHGDPRMTRLTVGLDLLRVEVPIGSISESSRIWSRLDEQVIGAQHAITLRRNGLRAGIGRPEAWEPIKVILDAIPDHLVYHESVPLRAGVFCLEVSGTSDDQTVFFFRDDGTMKGESFPGSRNVLQVHHEVDVDDPNTVVLTVVPEIRQHERRLEWARQGNRITRVPVYHGRILQELAVTARLRSGGFLVIGPGDEVKLASVVGRALLTRKVDGKQYESIYFLAPRVQWIGSGRTPHP